MSIATAISNAQSKVALAYDSVETMGGTLPETQNLSNLPQAIESIPQGGGGDIVYAINKTGSTLQDGDKVLVNFEPSAIINQEAGSVNTTDAGKSYIMGPVIVCDDDTIGWKRMYNKYWQRWKISDDGTSFVALSNVSDGTYYPSLDSTSLFLSSPNTFQQGQIHRINVKTGVYESYGSSNKMPIKDDLVYYNKVLTKPSTGETYTITSLDCETAVLGDDNLVISWGGWLTSSHNYVYRTDITNFPNCTTTVFDLYSIAQQDYENLKCLTKDWIVTTSSGDVCVFKWNGNTYDLVHRALVSNYQGVYVNPFEKVLTYIGSDDGYIHVFRLDDDGIYELSVPSDVQTQYATDVATYSYNQQANMVAVNNNLSVWYYKLGYNTYGAFCRAFYVPNVENPISALPTDVKYYSSANSFTGIATGNTNSDGLCEIKTVLSPETTYAITFEGTYQPEITSVGV